MNRRGFLRSASGLLLPAAPAFLLPKASWAQGGTIPGPGAVHSTGGGGYTGPGDIATFVAWWGLRAYSAATTGTSVMDVFGFTSSTTFTFVSKSDGTLELSAGGAAAFLTANSAAGALQITKVYDQTGNGHHMTTSAGPTAPIVKLTALGAFAGCQFNNSSNILKATGFAVAQPFSIVSVFETTTSGAIQCLLSDSTGAQFLISATPALRIQANTALNGSTLTTSTFFALQAVANGASSVATVNATDTSGTAGTNGITGTHTLSIGSDDFSETFTGIFLEEGVIASANSSGTRTSFNSNLHTYWGF